MQVKPKNLNWNGSAAEIRQLVKLSAIFTNILKKTSEILIPKDFILGLLQPCLLAEKEKGHSFGCESLCQTGLVMAVPCSLQKQQEVEERRGGGEEDKEEKEEGRNEEEEGGQQGEGREEDGQQEQAKKYDVRKI